MEDLHERVADEIRVEEMKLSYKKENQEVQSEKPDGKKLDNQLNKPGRAKQRTKVSAVYPTERLSCQNIAGSPEHRANSSAQATPDTTRGRGQQALSLSQEHRSHY